jgi:hypothetical protein
MAYPRFLVSRFMLRNAVEFAAIFALWAGELWLIDIKFAPPRQLTALIFAIAVAKTLFFGLENVRQLREACESDVPYHRFLALMVVNFWQIIVAFGLDFHALAQLDADGFAGVRTDLEGAALVFEFFYFSALNFMFFGFGDITPQTFAPKVLTLTEITLAFVTVIFVLSDFIGLKESLRGRDERGRSRADL